MKRNRLVLMLLFLAAMISCTSCLTYKGTNLDIFKKQFVNDFSVAETALYNEFAGEDILIWAEGTRFTSLKIDNLHKLQSVKIIIHEAYPGYRPIGASYKKNYSRFDIVFTFLNNKKDFEYVRLENSYSGDSNAYKNNFSKDLVNWVKK